MKNFLKDTDGLDVVLNSLSVSAGDVEICRWKVIHRYALECIEICV